MNRMLTTLALLALAAGTARAQQDTTKKPDTTRAAAAAAPAAASTLTVADAVVADSVADRAPQGAASTFPAAVGQVVCFTKVTGGSAGTTIHHVWFHGDTQVGDVELHVDGSPWRTWSRKTIPADWTGAWHVEIRDAAGTVLKRVDFTVGT